MRRAITGFLAAMLAVAALGAPASASPDGDPDPTLGTAGVATAFGSYYGARAMALQDDGAFVTGGFKIVPHGTEPAFYPMVARFHPDGTPDTSFADGGVWVGEKETPLTAISAVAVLPSGKILAAGGIFGRTDESHPIALSRFLLLRFLPDGTLDPAFGGGDGTVITDLNGYSAANGMVVQPDGRPVLVGAVYAGTERRMAVVRYKPRGALDPTFGSGGIVKTNFSAYAYGTIDGAFADVTVDGQDRIVAVGRAGYDVDRHSMWALARLRPNGALDASFSGDGKAVLEFPDEVGEAQAVRIRPNDRIIAAGSSQDADHNGAFVIAQWRPNGTPHAAFGDGGMVTLHPGGPSAAADAHDLILDDQGRAVVVGNILEAHFSMANLRLTPTGQLDTTWGTEGIVIQSVPDNDVGALAIARQPNGAIVTAGLDDDLGVRLTRQLSSP